MQTKRNFSDIRLFAGVLIWIGLLAGGWMLLRTTRSVSPNASTELIDYLGAQRTSIVIESPRNVVIGVGDPLFVLADGVLKPVGVVTKLDFDATGFEERVRLAWVRRATVTFFSRQPTLSTTAWVELHETDSSPTWVVETMLSESVRNKIRQLIVTAYTEHQQDLVEQFQPVIRATIFDAAQLIRQDLVTELESRHDQIDALRQRYQSDVLEKEILPVLQEEIWPIVQEEVTPLAEEVGREIWQEVSVLGFGWRYLYDRSPLPEKDLSRQEFEKFVKKKAIPIIESHFDDAIAMQQRLISRIASNKRLSAKVTQAAEQMLNDPEVKTLFNGVFRKVILDNPKLKASIEETWRSKQARQAMKIANARLEPVITDIGHALFGSPSDGIPPEFARVLRNRVLHKDDRWLVLHAGDSDQTPSPTARQMQTFQTLPLKTAVEQSDFPINALTKDEPASPIPAGDDGNGVGRGSNE